MEAAIAEASAKHPKADVVFQYGTAGVRTRISQFYEYAKITDDNV